MRFDYHVHTPLCQHATGHPREYVKRAVELGLGEIGFSDHNPMPVQFDAWRMAPGQLPEYFRLVEEARAEFPQIPVRLGLEVDYIEGYEAHIRNQAAQADWDYLIGSVHYILPGWDVDNPEKRNLWKEYSVEKVWELYFSCYRKAAESGLFDFLGHPDLVKKFGDRPQGDLSRFYREALDAIEAKGVAIEINTAGLRKPVGELYPGRQFLEEAFRRGIPVLVNSDAHDPSEVGADFDKAYALLHDVGYREVQRFVKRERIAEPIA